MSRSKNGVLTKVPGSTGIKSPWKRYGGKANLVDWIILNCPSHKSLVDVFGGAGNVVLSVPPARGTHIYNDLDGAWSNSFVVAGEQGDELARLAGETPFSRVEFKRALHMLDNWKEMGISPVQRALAHLIVTRMSFSATGRTFSAPTAGCISNLGPWQKMPEVIRETMIKMKTIAVENLDYTELFKKYDDGRVCFYCDPPYVGCEKSYEINKKDGFDHEKLREHVESLKASLVISYYDSPYIRDLYNGWYFLPREVSTHASQVKRPETELLIIRQSKYAEEHPREIRQLFAEGLDRYAVH